MKEIITIYGTKLLEYDNDKIYQRFRKTGNLCLLSLILSVLTWIVFIIINTVLNQWKTENIGAYLFFFFLLIYEPYSCWSYCKNFFQKPSKWHYKDYKYKKAIASASPTHYILDFPPYSCKNIAPPTKFPITGQLLYFLIGEILKGSWILFCLIFSLSFGTYTSPFSLYLCGVFMGYMAPAHILIWVAFIMLIGNLKLMRREWEQCPPEVVNAEKANLISNENNKKAQENLSTVQHLLEKCGMRFFIKYYGQIRRLPIRDIIIEEDYSAQEKNERITAVQQIIKNELTTIAIDEILNNYSDVLSPKEIETAQKIKNNL